MAVDLQINGVGKVMAKLDKLDTSMALPSQPVLVA